MTEPYLRALSFLLIDLYTTIPKSIPRIHPGTFLQSHWKITAGRGSEGNTAKNIRLDVAAAMNHAKANAKMLNTIFNSITAEPTFTRAVVSCFV